MTKSIGICVGRESRPGWCGKMLPAKWLRPRRGMLFLTIPSSIKATLLPLTWYAGNKRGNAHGVIKGIGVVTCIYVNPEFDQFWLIDYRIYDPTGDGKSKLDHVEEMLSHTVYHKQLPFQAVLMDTWYATKDLMLFIESLQKVYYCPLKHNRQVDDSNGQRLYQRVDSLSWSEAELQQGKRLKIKGFPKDHKVQCFRVEVSTHRTDFVVTNDLAQDSTEATQQACGFRWKIEQLPKRRKAGDRSISLPVPRFADSA